MMAPPVVVLRREPEEMLEMAKLEVVALVVVEFPKMFPPVKVLLSERSVEDAKLHVEVATDESVEPSEYRSPAEKDDWPVPPFAIGRIPVR